jgi:hypothetical protein
MRWLIGTCLAWLMVESVINVLSPAYDNVQYIVFHGFWLCVATAALTGLILGIGI